MNSIAGLQLPLRFDVDRMRADLSLIREEEWFPCGRDWRSATLRAASGAETGFHDTSILDRCSYFRELLATFECPLKSVSLIALAPASSVRDRADSALDFESPEVRLDIPIRTGPAAEFYLCGERLMLEPGQCYYVNRNIPRRETNRGEADRVHLAIDAEGNGWLRDVLARSKPIPRSARPPHRIDEFRQRAFGDTPLRGHLLSLADRRAFIREVVSAGAERGFVFHEDDVEAAFRAPSRDAEPDDLTGWTPAEIFFRDLRPSAEWLYAPGRRFTEPFFEDSIRAFRRSPFTSFFRREAALRRCSGLEPAGFVFHMSRCGSTLISSALGALPRSVSISEAPPVDVILQARRHVPALARDRQVEWLRDLLSCLGAPRTGLETHLFVKFDPWHIRSLPLIRDAFPGVPWLFVYRDPVEVLVSQMRRPGMFVIPGAMAPAILGLSPPDTGNTPRIDWCVNVLEGLLSAALEVRDDPHALFVNYSELPGEIHGRIASHFGLTPTADEEAILRTASRSNAKNPAADFAPDSDEKQREGSVLRDHAGVLRLTELYRELEAARLRTAARPD